jgi:Leucine-rich repeat (LRR) protein
VPWNFTDGSDPCLSSWEGVYCYTTDTSNYAHVQYLSLDGYQISGRLPESLGNLTGLYNLSMSANLVSGSLPVSLGQLVQLKEIDVSYNLMTGYLFAVSSKFTKLSRMNVGYNAITGTLPSWLCTQPDLEQLLLGSNWFSSTLPACLGTARKLAAIELNFNILSGTLPGEYGDLAGLQSLLLQSNYFNGTIPTEYARLTELVFFRVDANFLTGSVASLIPHWTQLSQLDLGSNHFAGTLPDSIGSLSQLTILFLYTNQLTGTLPNSMGNMTSLLLLDADANLFTGTLPASLSGCTLLQYISCYGNMFSGALPASWDALTSVREIGLDTNAISGTLPAYSSLVAMEALILSNNLLSAAIPQSVLGLPSLVAVELSYCLLEGQVPPAAVPIAFFGVSDNFISGTIPESILRSPQLLYFNVSWNSLTGNIPDSVGASVVNFLYLSGNYLTGTIPDRWAPTSGLEYFYCDDNFLSGGFPLTLAALPELQSLNLSFNSLGGTVPSGVGRMTKLQVLLLQKNRFTGSLPATLFNASTQKDLHTIQVSSNQLTGALPDSLALLPSLQVFAAVSNCFEGSIPESLCSSGSLNTLALDGLQSATSCQYKLFPAALEGSVVAKSLYSIRNPLSGGVPSCLFGMGNLTTLHLSGNGLTGTIPAGVSVSPALRDLSLSHNKLTGTIPAGVLQRVWANLDLSYNRLTGSLPGGNGTSRQDAALYLQQNRLSGKVPSLFAAVPTLSVLESNIFSCGASKADLPGADPDKDKYQCGSDTFNATLYAWIGLCAIAVVAGGALLFSTGHVLTLRSATIRTWWTVSANGAASLGTVFAAARRIVYLCVLSASYAVVVLLPVYAVCSALYGTYTHQYAWALSAAYLSGSTAFSIMLVFLVLLVGSVLTAQESARKRGAVPPDDCPEPDVSADVAAAWKRATVYCGYVLANFLIVLGANTAFVIVALNQNGVTLTLAQIALALFKVAFNSACSPVLMRWACQRFLGRQPSAPSYVTLQLFVSVVNNILVPCLVVAVISPSCFYHIFHSPQKVGSGFLYAGKCIVFEPSNRQLVTCTDQETDTAYETYAPPFEYSYECSSSFITYYSPAFVIMCMVAGFIPLAQVVLQRLHERAVVGSRWHAALDLVLPRILKPLHVTTGGEGGAVQVVVRNLYAPFFDASQHVITLLTYLALLMTFGAVFPPLAVCFAVTAVCMAVFARLKVGRFLTSITSGSGQVANDPGASESDRDTTTGAPPAPGLGEGHVAVLEQECEGVGSEKVLGRSVAMVVAFSCVFYTLFLFDTLGDAVGHSDAWWVVAVVPLLGPALLVCALLMRRIRTPASDGVSTAVKPRETEVEMKSVWGVGLTTISPITAKGRNDTLSV